ncbi:MoeA N-terminal region-domain-containing protein [Pelagophyceae sp. CCMP2097]|nr:MoeA N-terminal region-domain-containing protein [Pelagophyceae sp. CCMP2097]
MASSFPMIEVDEALRLVLLQAAPLAAEALPLVFQGASPVVGGVLIEDVRAKAAHPPFPAAISDGYALRAADSQKGKVLRVLQRASGLAGSRAAQTLGADECAYVATGAPLPQGADAVVPHESVAEAVDGASIVLKTAVSAGSDVRAVGSDHHAGEVLLHAGAVLRAWDVAIIAAAGFGAATVHKRPVVTVFSTGDELADPVADAPVDAECMVYDANRVSLLALLSSRGDFDGGAVCVDGGLVGDDRVAVKAAVLRGVAGGDVVVTTGGVSVGRADVVKGVLEELGAVVHFGRLNMKPGKPTTFATFETTDAHGQPKRVLFFALPGNPVSALVTAQLLVVPALKRLRGVPFMRCGPPHLKAEMAHNEYRRVKLSADGGGLVATDTGSQRSSRLLSMRDATALAWVPAARPGAPSVGRGATVDVLLIAPVIDRPHSNFFRTLRQPDLRQPDAAPVSMPAGCAFRLAVCGFEDSAMIKSLIAHEDAESPVVFLEGSSETAFEPVEDGCRRCPGLESAMRDALKPEVCHPTARIMGKSLHIKLARDTMLAAKALSAVLPALARIITMLEEVMVEEA